MTVSEAVNLVIQAGSLGRGGEIFILDMGEPVRIVDLARNLIGLQGFSVRDASRPDGDIAIEFIGLQPGEKLHETLVAEGTLETTEHPKISRAFEPGLRGGTLRDGLARLESACDRHDTAEARRILRELVTIPSTRPAAPGT
jgi:FlaA1/EpsC-like NDP-sugar epimerase